MSSDDQLLAELAALPDLSEVPLERLTQAARSAKERSEELQELTGRLIVQMNRSGMTFVEIGKLLEIPHSTAHYWAKRIKK